MLALPAQAIIEYDSEVEAHTQPVFYGRPHLSQASYPIAGLVEIWQDRDWKGRKRGRKVYIYKLDGTEQPLTRLHKLHGVADLRPPDQRHPNLYKVRQFFMWTIPAIGVAAGVAETVYSMRHM